MQGVVSQNSLGDGDMVYSACTWAGPCVSQHKIGRGWCDGVCDKGGGVHPPSGLEAHPNQCQNRSGRYASYWNAFLFIVCLHI